MSYEPKVYREQGGAKQVVASGGEVEVQSGGALDLQSGATFTVGSSPVAADVTMAVAAGGANVSEVTITVKALTGTAIAAVHQLDIWLSDDADGEGHTSTTASGTVQAKASSGLLVATQVAKKALTVQTKKTGIFILEITDTAKTAFKVCARVPGTGKTVVGATLATASYG